ncbi:Asp-tRNA(Asn)/Glu-tRNA(Gln) amidotransferase subunit GatB [Acidobacteriota bacterium]
MVHVSLFALKRMISPEYEPVIGLEIHAQLRTRSKLFCGCSTDYGSPPNTHTCPVCLGLPGSLPVLNIKALHMAVQFACFVKASIRPSSQFTRKSYFYPDLPKGYQITQYKNPFASLGIFNIEMNGREMGISISRINLEEDAGKSIHGERGDTSPCTYLDFNRSGIPLLEIVTAPELSSPGEAVEFLQQLRTSLQYLNICDGDMETGSLRCDANLSVRKRGDQKLGTRVELKNLNSFRFLTKALEHEFDRQVSLILSGQTVRHETRLWDEKNKITLFMRSKEKDQDYRYFPDPDLPPPDRFSAPHPGDQVNPS